MITVRVTITCEECGESWEQEVGAYYNQKDATLVISDSLFEQRTKHANLFHNALKWSYESSSTRIGIVSSSFDIPSLPWYKKDLCEECFSKHEGMEELKQLASK